MAFSLSVSFLPRFVCWVWLCYYVQASFEAPVSPKKRQDDFAQFVFRPHALQETLRRSKPRRHSDSHEPRPHLKNALYRSTVHRRATFCTPVGALRFDCGVELAHWQTFWTDEKKAMRVERLKWHRHTLLVFVTFRRLYCSTLLFTFHELDATSCNSWDFAGILLPVGGLRMWTRLWCWPTAACLSLGNLLIPQQILFDWALL